MLEPWRIEVDLAAEIDRVSVAESESYVSRPTAPIRNVFIDDTFAPTMFASLGMMRKTGQLCDLVLIVGNDSSSSSSESVSIQAHRLVLAANCPYFSSMFLGNMAESKQKNVLIQGLDVVALRQLIEYLYTGQVEIDEDSVQALLATASALQLWSVRDACARFLIDQLAPCNCLQIAAFAVHHHCAQLTHAANTFVHQHFTELVKFEEFLNLDMDRLIELVSNDRLTTIGEENVFEAALAWLHHDLDTRLVHLDRLMCHIRFPLLSQDYLIERVDTEPLMKESGDCKDLLIEALKFHLRHDTVAISATRTRPRQPLPQSKLIMLVGGQAPKAIVNVDLFDVDSMRWTSVADLPQRRCRCGLVELHGAVYAIGGFNGSSRVRSVDVFDVVRNMWSTGPAMEARRSTLGVAVLTELQLIMAVGGFDGSTGLASAEALDPRQGHWMPLASMTVRRSSVGVSALNGYTSYAVGGYDGHSRQCLNTVEVYDARANRWRSTGSLNIRRSGAGVTVLEGRLVAVGGHDGPLVLSEKNTWDRLVDMSIRRRNAAVVACTGGAESQLLAIGGDDGALNLSSIESLVMDQSAWTSLPANMSLARSYAGATLINKF